MQRCLFLVGVASIVLTGCMPFHPPARNATAPVPMPETFDSEAQEQAVPAPWWKALDSPELNRLVQTALEHNFSIRSAWARLRQARAQLDRAEASLWPSLEGSATGERTRSYREQTDMTTSANEMSYGVSASYELDLWGRARSARQAQVLSSSASRQDVEAAAASVVGQITATWLETLSLREQVLRLRRQIAAEKKVLRLQRIRYENGAIDGPTLTRQRRQVAATEGSLPDLQARLGRARNALATLVGVSGPDALCLEQERFPDLLPLPEAGLPARLMAERPDIQAAWLKLRAADWEVAVAQADMLPSLSLSAGRTYTNDMFSLDWTSWISRLTGNLTAPLFSGGRRLAEVERTRAVVEQRVADYGEVVLEAFQDVRDALVNEETQRRAVAQTRRQLQAARQALSQARLRYANGQSGYVDVVAEQASVAQFERQLVQQRAQLLTERVGVYRALGNAWTDSLSASGKSVSRAGFQKGHMEQEQ